MTDATKTPIEKLSPYEQILLDLNLQKFTLDAIKTAVHSTETTQLSMYEQMKRDSSRLRLAVATCVTCAVVCLLSTLGTLVTTFALAGK